MKNEEFWIDFSIRMVYTYKSFLKRAREKLFDKKVSPVNKKETLYMKHIKIIAKAPLVREEGKGGCGECQTSCQSACKTSCTVANQPCGQKRIRNGARISSAQ